MTNQPVSLDSFMQHPLDGIQNIAKKSPKTVLITSLALTAISATAIAIAATTTMAFAASVTITAIASVVGMVGIIFLFTLGLNHSKTPSSHNQAASYLKTEPPALCGKEQHPFTAFSHEINLFQQADPLYGFSQHLMITALKQCEKFQNAKDSPKVRKILDETKTQIGKLAYLADHDKELHKCLSKDKLADSLNHIKKQFSEKTTAIFKECNELVKRHRLSTLQNPEVTEEVHIPLAIANALITSSGRLNTGIIQPLKKALLKLDDKSEQWKKDLGHALDRLKDSKVSHIVKPADPGTSINRIIRTQLHLTKNEHLTDIHAKKAALAAFLSHLRQGPVGSCFATYLGIEIMKERLDLYLRDLAELIRTGNLSRHIKDKNGKATVMTFDFKPKISDEYLKSTAVINKDGKHANSTLYFWEFPGIIAACRQMGIEQPEAFKDAVLNELFGQKTQPLAVSPQQIIKAYATAAKIQDEESWGALAYSSETNSPLMRMWENTLAGMAEAKTDSFVTGNILSSVQFSLSGIWDTQQALYPATKIARKVFQEILGKSIHLDFDPKVPLQEIASDGSSTSGAFRLYQRSIFNGKNKESPINTPEEFQNFVVETAIIAQNQLNNIRATTREHKNYRTTMQKIQTFARTGEFIKRLLYRYSEVNAKEPNILSNWQSLDHLPWLDRTGNMAKAVFNIYMECISKKDDAQYFQPKSGQQLLEAAITFGRKQQPLKDCYPTEATGLHAFTFNPFDPSIKDAFDHQNVSIQDWIEKRLHIPGKAIADAFVKKESRDKLIAYASNWLVYPKSSLDGFSKRATEIKWQQMTVHNFFQKLLRLTIKMSNRDPNQISLRFANHLIREALPKGDRDELKKMTVKAFDTNWNDGSKEIYFGIFFNPASKTVDLGSIDKDGSNLRLINQKEWLKWPWDFREATTI